MKAKVLLVLVLVLPLPARGDDRPDFAGECHPPVIGVIEPRHFQLYIHSKGVFWQPGGVQEFVVKAFLMEIHQMRRPDESNRKPTWVNAEDAKRRLAKGREVKYYRELEAVIDRALERIQYHTELWGSYPARGPRPAKDPITATFWP